MVKKEKRKVQSETMELRNYELSFFGLGILYMVTSVLAEGQQHNRLCQVYSNCIVRYSPRKQTHSREKNPELGLHLSSFSSCALPL